MNIKDIKSDFGIDNLNWADELLELKAQYNKAKDAIDNKYLDYRKEIENYLSSQYLKFIYEDKVVYMKPYKIVVTNEDTFNIYGNPIILLNNSINIKNFQEEFQKININDIDIITKEDFICIINSESSRCIDLFLKELYK